TTTTRSSKSTFPCRTADPAGTATAASNNTDRPTPGTGTESIVGWSTPRVGHRAGARSTPHSAAGKTPTALRQAHRRGVDQGGQRLAWATGRGLGAHRTRRPERRRRPYARHTGTESIVGWSTPRVGHRAGARGTPHSAAGKTPTALRQAHRHGVDRRVVNASRWPPGAASVHTALGGRKDADRPTPGTQARSRSQGGQRLALATRRSLGAHRTRRPERRRRPSSHPTVAHRAPLPVNSAPFFAFRFPSCPSRTSRSSTRTPRCWW